MQKITCSKWNCQSFKNGSRYQKQPSRIVLGKRCSENMKQINRRAPMPKHDFSKVACVWVFSCHFAAYFQNTIFQRTPLDGCFWGTVARIARRGRVRILEKVNLGNYLQLLWEQSCSNYWCLTQKIERNINWDALWIPLW